MRAAPPSRASTRHLLIGVVLAASSAASAGALTAQGKVPPPSDSHDTITVERTTGASFMDRLVAEPDGASRRELLVRFLAATMEDESYFPYLGRLRADLRRVATGVPGFELAQALTFSAKVGLLEWGDPEDQALNAATQKEAWWFNDAPPGVAGPTLEAVCAAWAEAHFRAEKAKKPWTWHRCTAPTLDPTGTHAIMRFEVRYAHWEYELVLYLVREGDVWRLRLYRQSMIS